jgi:GAF domain-containing protein
VCAALIVSVALAAALIRGDRVLRLGMIAAPIISLPWALCQGLVACTDDPELATRLLRIGHGPIALVGPYLLVVALAANGQLERHRGVARAALVVGSTQLVLAWATPWTVPGVRRLPSGLFFTLPGPLTGAHIWQLGVWLAIGLWIARRSSTRATARRTTQLLFGVFAGCAIGALDTLLLYGVWGSYPVAWLPASLAATIALYLVARTDLVRPRGIDRGVVLELVAFASAMVIAALLALALRGGSLVALVVLASLAWTIATGGAWALARIRPARVLGDRALEQFASRATAYADEHELAVRLASLWQRMLGIVTRASWTRVSDELVEIGGTRRVALDGEIARWLARHGEPVALADLATMRLGTLRARLEAFVVSDGGDLVVPLVDRGELVGSIAAAYSRALREDERALVAESARAAARGLVFVSLAREADREHETAREVEIAEALGLHVQADRARLLRWSVAVERHGARATDAGWSAIELADGRLALIVVEAQSEEHGVAAALAIAAVVGAFAAALVSDSPPTLDVILAAIQANDASAVRGGVPLAAFVALLDDDGETIEWVCVGHRGGELVADTRTPLRGRGASELPSAAILVVSGADPRAPSLEVTVRRRET